MTLPKLQYVTTDVFTQDRYAGNPLAIVRVPASVNLRQDQKQSIAREFNYSETVILHESEESYRKSEWTVDIFFPDREIPLAGHPVIGTVCYLGTTLQATGAAGIIIGTLNTKAGKVPFTYSTSSKTASVEIPHDFHLHNKTLNTAEASQCGIPDEVCKAMVQKAVVVSIVKGMTFCLVELSSTDALGKLRAGLQPIDQSGLNDSYINSGIVGFLFYVKQGISKDGVTALRTRMIVGSLEDPATGSASSGLAIYLACYVAGAEWPNKSEHTFELTQGVEMGRKSVIGVQVTGDAASKRVDKVVISGSAVEVMEGSLTAPA